MFGMIVLFFTGLGLFAYLAIYNRYWADDWCYNADFHQLGFLGTLKGYMYITTYAANRFSLTFFSGLLYYLGIFGVQIMTPVNILLLFVALNWFLNNINKMLDLNFPRLALILVVAIVIYYSIFLTPDLYQSLYWRSGSLPYFEPVVFSVFVFSLVTYQGVLGKQYGSIFAIVAITSFFAGGFSEAGCATLITALLFYIGIAWILRKQRWAQSSLPTAIIALSFSLAAMITLILSPTNGYRLGLYGKSLDLIKLPFLIMSFSFDFVKYSFSDLPFPYMVIIGTSLLLGYLLYVPEIRSLSPKMTILVVLMIVVIAFVLIAASYTPSAYIEKTPPAPRTRIIPRFILNFALILIAWIMGYFVRQFLRAEWSYVLALFLLVLVASYSIYSMNHIIKLFPVYSGRAKLWDQRNIQILTEKGQGVDDIKVYAIDGFPVGGIRDFEVKGQGKAGYWINMCAARYYDVGVIEVAYP
jgi:hypothetical protein